MFESPALIYIQVHGGKDPKEDLQRQLRDMEQQVANVQEQLREKELREVNLREQLREKEQEKENSQRQLRDMEQQLRERGKHEKTLQRQLRQLRELEQLFQRQLREEELQKASLRVDVYSFGVLLCEMCIRELPDPERRDQQIAIVTNRLLRALVRRCVQTEPGARPSMEEIIEELEEQV
ncbi:hypothetical protein ACROYT_G012371 [Oculina patagonica]